MRLVTKRLPGVVGVEATQNRKLGLCSATYAAQASCPESCPFLGSGCYAEYGHAAIHTKRLNAEAKKYRLTAEGVAANEAEVIGRMSGLLDLRLHVVGDCPTPRAAALVSEASGLYSLRFGRRVWGYTHAWREVPRGVWGGVNMLASCEDAAQVRQAWRLGYAAAVTLPRFRSKKLYLDAGLRLLPCPEQATGQKDCMSCRLCLYDGKLLASRTVIAFAAHGQGKRRLPLPLLEAA